MRATLLAIVLTLLLISHVQAGSAQRATPEATPTSEPACVGGHLYISRFDTALEPFDIVLTDLRFFEEGRDYFTISMAEWRKFAEVAEQVQHDLKELTPPSGLEEVHWVEIDRFGLLSAYARTVEREGLATADSDFDPSFERLEMRTDKARQRAAEICPDLIYFLD